MDPAASTSRLSAYVAFGVQWNASAKPPRVDAARDAASGAGRVIDVAARRIDPDAPARKAPAPSAREATNVFMPVTTYAPANQPGQPVRLVQFSNALGQNFDAWA